MRVRRVVVAVAVLTFILVSALRGRAQAPAQPCQACLNPSVYLSAGSTYYHIDIHCKSLGTSPIARWLSEISQGYSPCEVCRTPPRSLATHPSVFALTATTPPAAAEAVANPTAAPDAPAPRAAPRETPRARPATPVSPGRCQAITKKGTQCSRNAQAGSSYCWQHQR